MPVEGWTQYLLGDLLTLEYGSGLTQIERSGEGYPVYGSSGLVGKHFQYLIDGPGIVVGRKGTVGAVVWSETAFWPIDTTYYVQPSNIVELRWLYWRLLSLPLNRLDTSTGVPGLNRNDAYALSVLLPPLPEQRVIAAILDAADEAIRAGERVIAKLRQIKAGLLHDLLTLGVDAQGRLRDPHVHPELFKDSLLGRIPREWEVKELSELADVDRGKFTHRPRNDPSFYGGTYPFIQTGDIASVEGGILEFYTQTLNEKGISVSREFPKYTIAITIAANIADTAILGIPMYFPDSIVGAIVKSPNNVRYVELCIRKAKPRLEAQAPQSAQKNINLEVLRPLLIATPNSKEQDRIAAVYSAHDARLRAEEAAVAKLRHVKAGLMEDLLTGRVRSKAL